MRINQTGQHHLPLTINDTSAGRSYFFFVERHLHNFAVFKRYGREGL
jgi:hypothetical protein